ncbi:MAG: VOC family protein [Alphaproteobacteria bacterium]|jgi:catechol 2,3-dioxygenase-like lactoylglutathione lyase family enzyme|nr:VOC family protein [Alphaproteobacteria bacterium]MDP6589278.1 VOC family protein [Alphaproteobacteria bacterium]MDP6818223.1 VOC family protein [Alphaproteobacteria bacterium]|tara:strand:- start:111 stop:680 length:570 start_codon:yes stop_codon:yes gene_type:complete
MNSDSSDVNGETESTGMPGLRGAEHIGFTVPDMDEAVHFFRDILGCREFYDLGEFGADGDWMTENLNVHPRANIKSMRMLRCAHGSNIELFVYESPDKKTEQPRNSDNGGHHIAFYVDDVAAAVAHLRKHNIKVCGDPKLMEDNPEGGVSWCYFVSPWGMQFELVSYPGGKDYEKDYPDKLWNPVHPAD